MFEMSDRSSAGRGGFFGGLLFLTFYTMKFLGWYKKKKAEGKI